MYRIFCLFLLLGSVAALQAADTAGFKDASVTPIQPDAPQALVKAWLRLNDEKLCLEIDTVFLNHEGSVQVWSLVKDEKSYKKLLKVLRPLTESTRVEIFAAERVSRDDFDELDKLPPSLWENNILRDFFGVPDMQPDFGMTVTPPLRSIPASEILRQRMIAFCRQTLERSENLKRYARDLPLLTRMTLDPSFDSDLRSLAYKACRAHRRGMEKQIDKLKNNLKHALPREEENRELSKQGRPDNGVEASPLELAGQISENARDIAKKVNSFIYPESHIVGLDELRSPRLLESLTALDELSESFGNRLKQEAAKF